jgi:hypothetical protein
VLALVHVHDRKAAGIPLDRLECIRTAAPITARGIGEVSKTIGGRAGSLGGGACAVRGVPRAAAAGR